MSNFTYAGVLGGAEPEERQFDVVAGTTASIAVGDIVLVANGAAALIADGEGAAGSRLGLATSTSTETVGADGKVTVQFSPAGLIVQGKATTPGNLAAAVLFDQVTIDVAVGVITIDENDAAGCVTLYDFKSDATTTGVVKAVLPFSLWAS